MHGVFGIGGRRSEDIYICICGIVSTILAVTRKTMAKGYEAREDQASK